MKYKYCVRIEEYWAGEFFFFSLFFEPFNFFREIIACVRCIRTSM